MTRGAMDCIQYAACPRRRGLTAIRVLEARCREGGVVEGGWICSRNHDRQQARESAGGDDKCRTPARASQCVLYGSRDSVAVPVTGSVFHDSASECEESRDSCESAAQCSRSHHRLSLESQRSVKSLKLSTFHRRRITRARDYISFSRCTRRSASFRSRDESF